MEQNQNKSIGPKFLQLWPTQFMSFNLPGNEQANHILTELVLEKNQPSEVKDCFEGLNRATFAFNQGLDKAIVDDNQKKRI